MPKLVTRYNSKIFNIDNDFASLRSIVQVGDNDVYRYEFNFDVDQISAIRNSILTTSIAIYLDRPQPMKTVRGLPGRARPRRRPRGRKGSRRSPATKWSSPDTWGSP